MRRTTRVLAVVAGTVGLPVLVTNGCSASHESSATSGLGGGGAKTTSSTGTSHGQGGSGGLEIPDAGKDADDDVMKNPCGSQCGPKELCDGDHLGLDDNCDGNVDEGCHCTPGQAHACFKGDPSYYNAPGCYPGVEKCTEQGIWGPCVGGVHATPDQKCYENNQTNCHPISATPFADVHLKDGTGMFSDNADPGSEVYTVTCPTGVSPCPAVTAPDDYKPIQSGEYDVTYQKTVNGTQDSCTFPLFVGAPGLRVELSWEHPDPPGGPGGVDLDLHLHEPTTTTPWSMNGAPQDCGYGNCKADSFPGSGSAPHWFPNTNMPPDPVNWDKDPVPQKNTCYFAPEPYGTEWQNKALGCHNPRLDADDISCNSGQTNPRAANFCYPENINVDYPPKKQWMRVGVYYYSNGSQQVPYSVHPTVKIFCNGQLAAELGSEGYYDGTQPVTFEAADGASTGSGNAFWEVADVAFLDDQCTQNPCVVEPIYSDPAQKTPFIVTDIVARSQFIPSYPPSP
ncbi:MAG TPA: hypothetical protein VHB21_19330 [Minicystis sp.]|nr:hypothetical protein [Minicystis sp.]